MINTIEIIDGIQQIEYDKSKVKHEIQKLGGGQNQEFSDRDDSDKSIIMSHSYVEMERQKASNIKDNQRGSL